MISFLSAIVVMLAIGTVVQRSDSLFGGAGNEVVALVDDTITVPANTLQRLDVFANDTGISESEIESLTVLSAPSCGRLLVRRGVLQYYATDECAGEQKIVYTLSDMAEPQVATVTAVVTSDRVAAAPVREEPVGDNAASDRGAVGEAPFGDPEVDEGAAAQAESDATPAEGDTDVEDAVAAVVGTATPAEAAAPAETEVNPLAAADDHSGDATLADGGPVSEPMPNSALPGASPPTPEVPATEESGVLAVVTSTKATDAAAPRPDVVQNVPESDPATIGLAVMPRAPDQPTAVATTPEAAEAGPDVAALDTEAESVTIPRTDAATGDAIVLGVATGRVPLPPRRSLEVLPVADDETGATAKAAETEIAALDPGTDAASADPEPGHDFPAADLVPAEIFDGAPVGLGADGGALSDPDLGVVSLGDSVTGMRPLTLGERSSVRAPATGAPAAATLFGPVARLGDVDLSLADPGQAVPHGDTGAPVEVDAAARDLPAGADDRVAAASPAATVPRVDQLRRDKEPDPVKAARELGIADAAPAPGDGRVPVGSTAPGEVPAANPAPGAPAQDTFVDFTVAIPAAREPAGDVTPIVGAERPAGAVSPELPGGEAPSVVPLDAVRVAAIGDAADFQDITPPAAALTGFVVDPAQSPLEPAPAESEGGDGGEQIAALPDGAAGCVIPPATQLEIRRAARTAVTVISPCHSESVAELSYSGLRVAIPLDRDGRGSTLALGFEANSAAIVRFADDEQVHFDLPFRGVDKIERVAVVWDQPVALELHALEFGAAPGGADHVNPQNPRDFSDVRRSGGGFLHSFRSYAGVGQNAQIYTHWKRRGAKSGIVKLMIDFASRNRDRLDGTCGDGPYAAPGFVVLRSTAGRLGRPTIRRLAALPCSRVSEEIGDSRLISGAIEDLVISN